KLEELLPEHLTGSRPAQLGPVIDTAVPRTNDTHPTYPPNVSDPDPTAETQLRKEIAPPSTTTIAMVLAAALAASVVIAIGTAVVLPPLLKPSPEDPVALVTPEMDPEPDASANTIPDTEPSIPPPPIEAPDPTPTEPQPVTNRSPIPTPQPEHPPPQRRVIRVLSDGSSTVSDPNAGSITGPENDPAATGEVEIRTVPSNATVSQNGERLVGRNGVYKMRPGTHKLELRSGAETYPVVVTVKPDTRVGICYDFHNNARCDQ
ncbi:MAG: hypothetical protein AAFV53_22545, partial [Myxococcota bacterium]